MAVRDLGIVTAYGYAKAGGYTGTEQEFTALLGDLALTVEDLENMTVSVTTLEPTEQATASYSDGVLSLGIPRGRNGEVTQEDLDEQLENYATNEDLYGAYIVKSASGDIASFSDGADDVPMKSVNVTITPKQSGSGDPSPSNVRPITGTSTANVFVKPLNLFPNTLGVQSVTKNGVTFDITEENGFIMDIYMHGTASAATSLAFANADNPYNLPAGSLKMYLGGDRTTSGSRFDLNARRAGSSSDIVATAGAVTITDTEPTQFTSAYIWVYSGAALNHHIMPCIVKDGVDITGYPKYPIHNGHTIPVPLGQTVYGGTVNPISGELTITSAMVDMGTLTWSDAGSGNTLRFYANPTPNAKSVSSAAVVANIACEKYTPASYGDVYDHIKDTQVSIGTNGYIYANDSSCATAAAFKTAVNGVKLVYEVATPTTVQLTPAQVATLLGTNNVWSDAGSVAVEYRADPTLAYAEISPSVASVIAPVESTNIATRNYTTGSLLIMNNTLYKVTANIANGGAITPNTNVTATTLAEVISAL